MTVSRPAMAVPAVDLAPAIVPNRESYSTALPTLLLCAPVQSQRMALLRHL